MVEVRVAVRRLGAELDPAVAIADHDRAHGRRSVHGEAKVVEEVAVRLNQEDVAPGAHRTHHVEIERDLLCPPHIGSGIRGVAVLVDLPKATVRRGARRKPGRGPVRREVALGIGIVVRVDDRHSSPRPERRGSTHGAVRGLEVGRPVGTTGKGVRCDALGARPGADLRRGRVGADPSVAVRGSRRRGVRAGVDVDFAVGAAVLLESVPALRRSRGGGTRWASRVIGRSRDRRNAHQETDGDEAAQKHASATTAQWRPRRTRTGTANVRPHVRPISLVHPR